MASDLDSMRRRAAGTRSVTNANQARLVERYQRKIEENNKRRAAAEEAARQAELEQQKINAQAARDKRLQGFEQQNTNQRAGIAANQAGRDFGYRTQLADQQQEGQLKRDDLQNRFETARQRQLAKQQEERDLRQFGFSQQQDETQFRQQSQRDATQMGYQQERDRFQQGATLERDFIQNEFGAQRDDRQQRNTLQRDDRQFQQQQFRDERLNQFDTQRDDRQQQNLLERDEFRNDFAVESDERQQGYNRQNMYQREAAEVSARWQQQISEARNNGLDFSERQQQEMREMDAAFRKNVLNSDLDEGLKQQAMVEYQKGLSAIIPEEKVRPPQQTFNQSIVRDEETGQKYMAIRDPKGFDRFEEMPGPQSDPSQERQAQAEQKRQEQQQQATRKAEFERETEYSELVNRLKTEIDATTGSLIYADKDGKLDMNAVREEAKNQFARREALYENQYGLPPLAPYQADIDQARQQQEQDWLAGPSRSPSGQSVNPYRQRQQNRPAGNRPSPNARKPLEKATVVSSSSLDERLSEIEQSGDVETTAAMRAVKEISAKYNGAPPDGSEEQELFREALLFLEAKGVSFSAKTRTAKKAKPVSMNPRDYDNMPGNL